MADRFAVMVNGRLVDILPNSPGLDLEAVEEKMNPAVCSGRLTAGS